MQKVGMSRKHSVPFIVSCLALLTGCVAPPTTPETTTNVSGTDGVSDPEEGDCFLGETPGVVGERYQCQGYLEAEYGAAAGNGAYAYGFGYPDSPDSYERPYVEACCLPRVIPEVCPGGPSNQHEWACHIDAVQQMCMTLGTKVEETRLNSPVFLQNSLASLRDWLNQASSIDECAQTFIVDTGLDQFACDQDPSLLLEGVTWNLSETDFGFIQHPYWRIAHLVIEGAYKPKEGAECVDNRGNDHNLPTEIGREGDIVLVLAAGSTTLSGPDVTADANLASVSTGCLDRDCSFAVIDLPDDANLWTLGGLQLQSAGSSSAGVATMTVDVEDYTISLFGPVAGSVEVDSYQVPAGAALFTISGRTTFGTYGFSVSNTTPIVFHSGVSGWSMDPFQVGFTDQNGDDWSLVIDAATWLPDLDA